MAAPRPMKIARKTIGAQDPVEQHPVLVLERHHEGREDQGEDEDVVDRQAEFQKIAGEVRRTILRAARGEDDHTEGQAKAHVERTEGRRLTERRHMRPAVEYEQVQGEDRGDRAAKDEPKDGLGVQGCASGHDGMSGRRSPPTGACDTVDAGGAARGRP